VLEKLKEQSVHDLIIETAKIMTLNEFEIKFFFMFLKTAPFDYHYLDRFMPYISKTFPHEQLYFSRIMKQILIHYIYIAYTSKVSSLFY